MGHIVNPISLRLNLNTFWHSSWVTKKNIRLFGYLILNDVLIHKFIRSLMHHSLEFKKQKFVLFSHIKIFYLRNKINFLVYLLNMHVCFWIKPLFFSFLFRLKYFIKNKKNNISLIVLLFLLFFKFIFHFYISTIYVFFFIMKKKLNYFFKNIKFFFSYNYIEMNNITAHLLAFYVSKCLEFGFSFNKIFFPLLSFYEKNSKNIKGIRVFFGGRYSRRQRASFQKIIIGKVSLNHFLSKIDYATSIAYTRYGVGGVKVWLVKNVCS